MFEVISCTTITYRSSGQFPVYVYDITSENVIFDIEGKREFFLWGFYPGKVEVVIDEEVERASALVNPSMVKIEEYQTFFDYVLSASSLGLYIPKRYRISGKGPRK